MYYFASDIHLGLEYRTPSREREKTLVRWLDEVSADARAIFLVGDVFDFWFEYKRVVPRGFTRLLGKLSELTDRGVEIHFFTGNHDMWVRDYLSAECGLTVHTKAEMFELHGKRVFVAHGDDLYLKKPLPIKFMHWCFRSPFVRNAFVTLIPVNQTIRFGHWWSGKSRKSKCLSHDFGGEREYLVQYAREYLKTADADYFIFGHLHCSADYDLGGGRRLFVLGEWIVSPAYAVLAEDGEIEMRSYK